MGDHDNDSAEQELDMELTDQGAVSTETHGNFFGWAPDPGFGRVFA